MRGVPTAAGGVGRAGGSRGAHGGQAARLLHEAGAPRRGGLRAGQSGSAYGFGRLRKQHPAFRDIKLPAKRTTPIRAGNANQIFIAS